MSPIDRWLKFSVSGLDKIGLGEIKLCDLKALPVVLVVVSAGINVVISMSGGIDNNVSPTQEMT